MTGRAQPRRAARVDANQGEITAALRAIGCVVAEIRHPVDLLIGYRGRWLLGECKDGAKPPSARKLTPAQASFISSLAGSSLPVLVLTSPEQAVAAVCAGVG